MPTYHRKSYEIEVFQWTGQEESEWPEWLTEAGAYTEPDMRTLMVIPTSRGKGYAKAEEAPYIICRLNEQGQRLWIDGVTETHLNELFEPNE